MVVLYRKFAHGYYQKNGRPTGTIYQVLRATDLLCQNYGRTDVSQFGPLALKAYQADLIARGLARRTINHFLAVVRRMIKWAVAEELVSPVVHQALLAVPGVRKGRSTAKECPPVRPVDDEVVEATLPHLPTVVADMVRFQRLTGCRPGEVCLVRPCDVDTSGEVWAYRPESHKTEHYDRERVIFIGPRTQEVLRPYLLRDKTSYCFVPAESERKRNEARRQSRASQVPASRLARKPKRKRRRPPGERYTTDAYRRAIRRAVDKANRERLKRGEAVLPNWHPNQIRHTAGTSIRQAYGLEAAQVTLGHATANVTQVYAERNLRLAAEVMKEVG